MKSGRHEWGRMTFEMDNGWGKLNPTNAERCTKQHIYRDGRKRGHVQKLSSVWDRHQSSQSFR